MKHTLYRIIASAILFIIQIFLGACMPDSLRFINIIIFAASYITVAYDVLWKAIKNIGHGRIFDENFLMSVASIGAIWLGEVHEAVALMIFYQIGELFESYAVNKSRKSISALMEIRPEFANIEIGGEIKKVNPDQIKVGDCIVINPGERIPLDGVVLKGSSVLDNSALTGETLPVSVKEGDAVLSGGINKSGVLTVKVNCEYGESTVSRILELVENASEKKTKSESFVNRFAAWYTPTVVVCAVLLAVIPPLIFKAGSFSLWVTRALTFLVVSCPCALVISVPLSFFGGIGAGSKNGILFKGGISLEQLKKVNTMVFDKTGTLTEGIFSVNRISPASVSSQELLQIAAYCEAYSTHPVAVSIKNAYEKEIDRSRLTDVSEISGLGISAVLDGKKVLAGNRRLLEENNIECPLCDDLGTVVYIARENEYLGMISVSDKIKTDSKETISELKKHGIKSCIMLSGDKKNTAEQIGSKLGISQVYSELLPTGKVDKLEKILESKEKNKLVAYVGDGINDAPSLAMADVGIAMGGIGSDAAIEASDIVIMTDEPSKILQAIHISNKTVRIANENVIFALFVKIAVLILTSFGFAGMWAAVFADVGVTVIAIFNALRALNTK